MPDRPRILVLAGPEGDGAVTLPYPAEPVQVGSPAEGLARLRAEKFDGVYLPAAGPESSARATQLFQAEGLLDSLCEGVALIDPKMEVRWANCQFRQWCEAPPDGKGFYEALGSPQIIGPEYSPFHTSLAERKPVITRLLRRDNRTFELLVMPVHADTGQPCELICLLRDITAIVQQQQKLAALHQAGQELSALAPDELSEMGVAERVELLKSNIRRCTRDLLRYDVVEVRLLDRQTNRLEPLLEEGMTPEAAGRALEAKTEGNGVTGFVAATGKSYICTDAANDPLYIEGAAGARSSLTVPLQYQDQVIGTFNVESPRPGAFGEDDLQFVEIFCREIANALHTLELLSAEKRGTASRSIEAINREVVLPVDDVIAAATTVLDRYIGHDPQMAEELRRILASARSIKQKIQKVGDDLAPAPVGPEPPAHAALKGLRVLVADADERVRRSAHGLLGSFGCVVETARDGQQALTMARQSAYDAILVDIRLPDLSGYDAFCKLKEAQPKARVLLMTAFGYDPSHAIVKCRQEGLRSVLYKPFRIDQLVDALEGHDQPGPPARPSMVRT